MKQVHMQMFHLSKIPRNEKQLMETNLEGFKHFKV